MRVYRGRCANNAHVAASLARFSEQRDTLSALIDSAEGLTSYVRGNLLRYAGEFYRVIDDPRRLQRSILDKCVD